MKRTALAGLFISAVMLASPVFAAETVPAKDDLCAINLQSIENAMATSGQTSENTADDKVKTKAKKKKYITGAHGSGSAMQKAKYRQQRANRHR